MSLVSLPEMVKPEIYGEEMCICSHGNDRGGWGGRISKEQKGNLGRSDGWVKPNFLWECITIRRASRKSERFVVAMKWL